MLVITKQVIDALQRHVLDSKKGREDCLKELKFLGVSEIEANRLISENK